MRWLGAFILLLPALCLGAGRNFTNLDVGAYVSDMRQRVLVPEGYRSLTGSIGSYIRIRRSLHLGKSVFFEPSYGVVLPWRSGDDGFAKVLTSHFNFDFGLTASKVFRFRAGPGLLWLLTFTNGEPLELNNGTGTATFYVPSGPSNAFLFTLQGGVEVVLSRGLSFSLDVHVPAPFDRLRRRFHGSATVGVKL